ncbi:MAG: PfkB family carbohydrate kinase [Bifidobacteriaceae bacterium]|jgi:sugar/nucleoside kinase (ribokinase family)|nr:PfkB family carbohydrate kinase [Bifidobacteriaceae bacterium]
MMAARLIHTGNALVDLVVRVGSLPPRGGDVFARGGQTMPGGGLNLAAAAARQGLAVVYAGAHGLGPRGDLVRSAMAREGVELAGPPIAEVDTGLVVVMVEPDGERTFVTVPGAEARLDAEALARVAVRDDDIVYLTGYSLAHRPNRTALVEWMAGLAPRVRLVFDPGPLAARLARPALAAVTERADYLSANLVEAAQLAGPAMPADRSAATGAKSAQPPGSGESGPSGRRFAARTGDASPVGSARANPPPGTPQSGQAPSAAQLARRLADEFDLAAVVRAGADGCFVAESGLARVVQLPAYPARVVDTNGAGDTHTGVLIAGLAAGLELTAAARRANAAAALAIGVEGGAAGPGPDAVDALLAASDLPIRVW